ncbi:MAG: HAMP domain-containing histidine kinase [Gloeobacteraceae cyanobacterium ES-bin-316]|nr:HAMP domain-containing histidine kinase [Ferruginibacter sp.]
MLPKSKKISSVFFIYWVLLAYIVAALIFWFITLNKQNQLMSDLKKESFPENTTTIEKDSRRKELQYIGEGTTFLLVIMAGAIFFYRAVKRQFRISQEQQNFMMAITHELKTPIAIAKLNLETLQKRKLDEQQQHRLLHNTLHETTRLDTLCNNMLISSQIEAGGYQLIKEELNLGKLLDTCAGDFTLRYPQRTFFKKIEEDIILTGDAMLLQIAFNNLMENAIKYSAKDTPVHINLELNDTVAEIQIKDGGPGIADEEKKKIFDKFYRLGNEATKRAKGTGLGLYITRKIIKNHGGNIFIQNNTPAGSIFTIQLAVIV